MTWQAGEPPRDQLVVVWSPGVANNGGHTFLGHLRSEWFWVENGGAFAWNPEWRWIRAPKN